MARLRNRRRPRYQRRHRCSDPPATGGRRLRCRACPQAFPSLGQTAHFDGAAEAELIGLACSKPPKGRKRWTLQLLEEQVVELKIVDRASDNTIGRTLKKTFSGRICRSDGSSHRMPTPSP